MAVTGNMDPSEKCTMYSKLLTKQPEQLQVLLIQASIDRNNLRTEIWKGLKTSAHVEGAYT